MKIDMLRSLYPQALPGHLEAMAARSDEIFDRYEIRSGKRLVYFLAQIGHESGGLTRIEENLNYSAERMMAVWPKRFATLAAAAPFVRQPERLAKRTYGGRNGNGPEASGDGWRYRGRGYIQLTGRGNYREIGDVAGLDLENDPDLATAPDHALEVACAFWRKRGINPVCDSGTFLRVSMLVNGDPPDNMPGRTKWLSVVERAMLVPAA